MKQNRPMASAQLSQQGISPGIILAILIGGIFIAEVIAMIVVFFVQDWPYVWTVILDATIMTVIIFPLLYRLAFLPLVRHIDQLNQSERILEARLRILEYARLNSLDALLQFTVDETEKITRSEIGFFHFLEPDQKTLRLQAWSTHTLQSMCKAEGKDSHYDVDEAGVWADAVRQRQPVLHNDYAVLPGRKGMPDGHAQVKREMVIPILRNGQVVAILGVGNKAQDYTDADVQVASTLGDFAWDVIEHKRDEISLTRSEAKFRMMTDWTYDWELWLDPDSKIVYSSPSCERITGYAVADFYADSSLMEQIVHREDHQAYQDHKNFAHDSYADPIQIEFRIVDRVGTERWIEHICRPLFDETGKYLGRRISNRDISPRKIAQQTILEQTQREQKLTEALQNIQLEIGRDLHDTLGQNISFLRMNLEHLAERGLGDATSFRQQLENMTQAANESYDLIRSMLGMLQMGLSSDLVELFSRYGEQLAERARFRFEITSQGTPISLYPNQVRQLFYIFREALNNVEKHAKADLVRCQFYWGEHALTFTIADNGRGFDASTVQAPGHYGLSFMSARANLLQGSLSVESDAENGTRLTLVAPYEIEPVEAAVN